MPDLYRILGLLPGAREEDIKAAYRALAKDSHPDVNRGDAAAELRTKQINRAYETLRNAEARGAYDASLLREHMRRRRRLQLAGAAFALAVTAGLCGAYWSGAWERRGPDSPVHISLAQGESARTVSPPAEEIVPASPADGRDGNAREASALSLGWREGEPTPPAQGTAMLLPPAVADTAPAEDDPPAAPLAERLDISSWTLLRHARLGLELRYPAHIFAPPGGYAGEHLRLFLSRDGKALLRVFAAAGGGTQLSAYRHALVQQRYAGARFDVASQEEDEFVLAGVLGGEAFYEHAAASCDGRSIHGWQVVYPLAEQALYAGIVTEMRLSYRRDGEPGWSCRRPPASRVTGIDQRKAGQ
jgi:hypothetical protein